jgi:copper chaperone CopZ
MQKKFSIEVDCANCAAKIETAIQKIPGVHAASVSFLAQKMSIDADEDKFDQLIKEIKKTAKRIEPDFQMILK